VHLSPIRRLGNLWEDRTTAPAPWGSLDLKRPSGDATPEALASLMAEQGRRMAVLSELIGQRPAPGEEG